MANHLDYLEETGMTASEWEKATNAAAQDLVDVLRKEAAPTMTQKRPSARPTPFWSGPS